MNEIDVNVKRDSLKKWLSIGGIVGGALLAGVFYMLMIQAFVGVVALGAAAVAGYGCVMFAPVVAQKIANAKYRAIDAENVSHTKKVAAAAASNPIETLQQLLIKQNRAVKEFEKTVTDSATARDVFKAKCEKFARQYPNRAGEFQKQLANATKAVEMKKAALTQAHKSLADGQNKLEEMRAYWEMSQSVQELNRAAGMDTGDAYERLKADTACDAVFESMARAFAELEVAASANDDAMAIENSPSDVLELEVREVTQKVKA